MQIRHYLHMNSLVFADVFSSTAAETLPNELVAQISFWILQNTAQLDARQCG